MPFVPQNRRDDLDTNGIISCQSVGDICYLAYKQIMALWKAGPRWTTIHGIRRDIEGELGLLDVDALPPQFDLEDVHTAELLAFDVFFETHAMGYEIRKREENGDIE